MLMIPRSAVSFLVALTIPLGAVSTPLLAKAAVAPSAVFSVTDATGRRLGLLSIDRRASRDPGRSRTAFESPSGRILVATSRRDGKLAWTVFREAGTSESLVVWSRRDLGGDTSRVPTIYVLGDSSVGRSWARKGDTAEGKKERASLAGWVAGSSPSLAKLLREAVEASIVSQSAALEMEGPGDLQRIILPMVPIYSVFGRPQDSRAGQTAMLRDAGPDATKRLLAALEADSVPSFAVPDTAKRWSGLLSGGREEKLGQLSLGWKGLTKPGALQATFATLEWAAGSRGERAHVMFYGPGGGYFARIERKTGGDWTTVATIDGFGEVEGDGWWAPYRLGDRFAKEGAYEFVEIPPSGDRDIQKARSGLLDAFQGAMGRSGLSGADAEEMLFRWQRILNVEQVRDSLPQLKPLASILSEAPMPVFRNEADEAWAGSVELRVSDRP